MAFSLSHLLLITAEVFVLLSDVLQGRQREGGARCRSLLVPPLSRSCARRLAARAGVCISVLDMQTSSSGDAGFSFNPGFRVFSAGVLIGLARLFLDEWRHLWAAIWREARVTEEGAKKRQEHEEQAVSEVQREKLEDQHQGLCPCHPTLAAEGSGARGGEAAPLSRGQARFHGVGSRVRCARASVRRNGGAVPTSRERGP
ncbi:hypothetical protein SAMN05216601_106149 [Ectopseudomonas composti]|uniref:Uncharacterized protein n=1 Tax=Ectopseudomonas composti TaxID=658457 RepID=A0A1I5N821_9GAMM|nr:hypothetical protein SAMN05216601_106149 [Pseudomonas composti]